MPSETPNLDNDQLLAHIDAAFRHVSRDGGVSWSESRVIDDHGTIQERLAARQSDSDREWTQVAADPTWWPDPGIGGFSFLDPIGFRYYLPAAMKRCIAEGHDIGIAYYLTLSDDELDDWRLTKWSLLNDTQRHCLARFLRCMIDITRAQAWGEVEVDRWRRALDRYWHRFEDQSSG